MPKLIASHVGKGLLARAPKFAKKQRQHAGQQTHSRVQNEVQIRIIAAADGDECCADHNEGQQRPEHAARQVRRLRDLRRSEPHVSEAPRPRAITDYPRAAGPKMRELEPRPYHRGTVLHRAQAESRRV